MAHRQPFHDNDFTEHYWIRYGSTGRPYADFQPAYRFGWELAHEDRYRARAWDAGVEQEAQHEWSKRGGRMRWDEMRDAIREGYHRGHSSTTGATNRDETVAGASGVDRGPLADHGDIGAPPLDQPRRRRPERDEW